MAIVTQKDLDKSKSAEKSHGDSWIIDMIGESPECFLCGKIAKPPYLYWDGATDVVVFHRACAISFKNKIQPDIDRVMKELKK